MPQAIVWAVALIGAEIGSAVLIMYAAEIATAAIILGGLAYSSAKAKQARQQAKDQYNAAQVDRLASLPVANAPRDMVLGRVRKGGTIFYRASTGANSQDLYMCIALAGHEIDAVEQIYLNDVPVDIDEFGNVSTAPYGLERTVTGFASVSSGVEIELPANYIPGSVSAVLPGLTTSEGDVPVLFSMKGALLTAIFSKGSGTAIASYQYKVAESTVKITKYLGASGQTVDPDLAAAFPSDWTSSNVVQGVAYLVVKMSYNETAFPSGVPNVSARIRGAKVYDPRIASTAWSDNPALMVRHVYQHPKFGKAAITAAEDARIIAAANACNTIATYTVDSVPSYVPLYRAGVVAPFGTPAKSLLDDLAQSMGGSWAFAGGELYIKPGVYSAPVMALTDADLAVVQRSGATESQRPISISVHKERAQKFNTVKATIWDSEQDYKQSVLTPLVGSALLTRDGVELVQEINMPAVGYAPQAQHVAGIMMRDARDALVVELPFKLRAYPLELFDVVSLTLSRYGWSAKTFMILGRSWSPDGTIMLTLKETTAAITQMDAGFLAQGFAENTNLPKPWVVAGVGALTVTSGASELMKQADGTIVSRMRVSWTQIADAAVRQNGHIEAQYRLASSAGAWSSMVVSGEETQAVTSDVADGAIYIIRARAKTSVGVGDWCTQVAHQVIGKTEPPPAFDTFIVMTQPDGTRQFNFGYTTTAQPVDWQGAQIRYVPGDVASPVWADMIPLQDGTSYYTASPVEANAPMAGEYTFACRSMDTTGHLSTALLDTIVLSKRRTGNVFDEFDEQLDGWTGALGSFAIVGGTLEATDSTTWADLTTWTAWTRWNTTPASPCTYTTANHDLGTVLTGQIDAVIDADGTTLLELATSADGTTWSAYGSGAAPFTSRWVRLRLTVAESVDFPVPVVRGFYWMVSADTKREYINDLVISGLAGVYRVGTGDIRVPLANTYTAIKRIGVTIQDSSAGTWTYQRIDNVLTYGPRFQFKLSGTLADPAFIDFDIEGI